jgi:site-specific recombinase XerD
MFCGTVSTRFIRVRDAAMTNDFYLSLSKAEMCGRRLSPVSLRNILKSQRDFLCWAEENQYAVPAVGKKELRAYHVVLCNKISLKTGKPLSPETVNAAFHAVSTLFALFFKIGVIEKNPCHALKLTLPEHSGVKRRPLTRKEIFQFFDRIDITRLSGLKDRTMFELIYSSGLRVSEAAALKTSDIDFQNRRCLFTEKAVMSVSFLFRNMPKSFLCFIR